MSKGFGTKQIKYVLDVSHGPKIPFVVQWDRSLKDTDKRAINTSGLIWGLLTNGTQELYDAVAEKLDADSADVIMGLYQEYQRERLMGNLKAQTNSGKWARIVEYATHADMRRNLRKYEAIDFARAL